MDILWITLTIPAILFALFAQWKLKSTYGKYSKITLQNNLTGISAGELIIKNNSLEVTTEIIDGDLTDHYDSGKNIMRISRSNTVSSIAGVAVVAHELGHAMQDKENMSLLTFRNAIVPMVNIGSTMGYFMILIGLILGSFGLAQIGILFFSLSFIFCLITLPIEYNASSRAMKLLTQSNILEPSEIVGAREVLSAAALTYVAGAASSLSQLLYFIFEVNRKR